jgi:hypothetical protein
MSPLERGLLSLSSSSTFGSIAARERFSQPRVVLYCARARVAFNFLLICVDCVRVLIETRVKSESGQTLPSSARFKTASATTSGCFFFQGEDILKAIALAR